MSFAAIHSLFSVIQFLRKVTDSFPTFDLMIKGKDSSTISTSSIISEPHLQVITWAWSQSQTKMEEDLKVQVLS